MSSAVALLHKKKKFKKLFVSCFFFFSLFSLAHLCVCWLLLSTHSLTTFVAGWLAEAVSALKEKSKKDLEHAQAASATTHLLLSYVYIIISRHNSMQDLAR